MKRFLAFLLMLCLALSVFSVAAADKPVISKQPETQTVKKGGSCSFTTKIKNAEGITWYFINPETGEKTTARNITKIFKKLVVKNPNGQKLTLKKVPEEMHGWTLYCQAKASGYTVKSDTVMILIAGKEAPSSSAAQSTEPDEGGETATTPDEGGSDEGGDSGKKTESAATEKAGDTGNETVDGGDGGDGDGGDEDDEDAPPPTITITAKNALLYKTDRKGNIQDSEGQAFLTFEGSGNFAVKAEEATAVWTINGVKYQPSEPVTGFVLIDVRQDMTISAQKQKKAAVATPNPADNLDYTNQVHIECSGCTFTFMASNLIKQTSGDVPAGAEITIIPEKGKKLTGGYIINGASPVGQGFASYKLTVTEDTEIKVK